MRDRLKKVPSSVWHSEITRDFVGEIGKVYLVLMGIGLVLLGTFGVSRQLHLSRSLDNFSYSRPSGFGWELVKERAYQEPVVEKMWWEIGEGEMNRNRVIYNWMNKPGLRLLGWQMVSVLIGMALILHKTKLWRVVSVGDGGREKVEKASPDRGVVTIRAVRGVIYISGLPDIATDMVELGLFLKPAWVVVE